jgi:succinate dehydrogenase / fumarate reductase cytochrome b subunit
MGASGLLLLAFLVVHVAGNLVLFAGRDAFNGYSYHLVSNPLIYVAELALLVLFTAHLVAGIVVTARNRAARRHRYAVKHWARGKSSKSHKSVASSTMIVSGVFMIAFVPLHLWTFKWGPNYPSSADPAVRDLYRLVIEEFRRPLEVAWYVGAMLVIGFHLWHGFASGCESLGVDDRDWLRRTGQVLAVAITGGFVIVPIAIWLGWVPA